MNKGTILYIGFFSLPDKDAAAHRVINNAKILRSLGYEVVFVDEQKEYPYEDLCSSERIIDGFTVYSLKRPEGAIAYLKKMVDICQVEPIINKYSNIKMVIAYNYPSIALNKLMHRYGKKIRICSDCSEWYSGKEYGFPLNIFAKFDSFYRMRIVNKKLDGIIAISSYLEKYYCDATVTVNIPPLVDIREVIWHQQKYEYERDKINLVYAGSPGRCKDLVKPIIEAVNNSSEPLQYVLRIVGITKEQYLEQNADDSANIGKNNIIFLGRVSHEESVKIVSSSDYLIFLRERNRVSMAGFSTKFVEAATCGTSVITTDTGDLKQYISGMNLGYVLENPQGLSSVLNLPFEILKKDSNDSDNIKDLFDFNKYTNRFEEWIERVINRA